jgi:hypothetical protein
VYPEKPRGCTNNKCTNTAPKHLEYSPKQPGVTKSQIGVAPFFETAKNTLKTPSVHLLYTLVHPVTPRVHPRVYPGVPGVPRKTSGVYKRCTTNKCTNTAPKHLEYSPKKPGVTKSQIGVAQLKTPALHHTPALHPALHPDYTPDYTPGELLLFLDLPIIINLKASL